MTGRKYASDRTFGSGGDPEQARNLLDAAHATYLELGMHSYAAARTGALSTRLRAGRPRVARRANRRVWIADGPVAARVGGAIDGTEPGDRPAVARVDELNIVWTCVAEVGVTVGW